MSIMLSFRDINYTLNEARKLCVSGEVASGEVLQITGPSGCGKSTLLRLIARLIPRESGTLHLQTNSDAEINPLVWRTKVHYFAQKSIMTEGSVWQNIIYPFSLKIRLDHPKPDHASALAHLRKLGLSDDVLDQTASTLSWGEKQRIALVRSLLMEPKVLLLDEPTASLDESSRQAMMALIAEWLIQAPERAVLLVSHNDEQVAGVPLSVLSLG